MSSPSSSAADAPDAPAPHSTVDASGYQCKKCRLFLVAAADVMPHAKGDGQVSFEYRKRAGGFGTPDVPPCTSLFVPDQPWMAGVTDGAVEGKINCPKCAARLGSFAWSGSQCSCGVWVTPSIQLHLNKIDLIVRR